MLLPEVTAWSVDHSSARYANSARYMGIAAEFDSDQVATTKLVDGLRQLTADLSVPTPAEFGIERDSWLESLDLMAQQALASGSPNNNPRIPDADAIVELYRRVWV
jgi:alcohol dehydrogenase class IV